MNDGLSLQVWIEESSLKMEAAGSYEMLVTGYQTARLQRSLTEDTNLHSHYSGFLKSDVVIWKFLKFESEELAF